MKVLIPLLLLFISTAIAADERIEFNHQSFILNSGFCMSIFKGDTQFGWCITSFSMVAEQKVSKLLAEKLAFKECDAVTAGCVWFKSICAN